MIDYPPLALLRAEAATLLAGFRNVRLIAPIGANGRPVGSNMVLVASNGPLPPQHGAPADGARVIERPALTRLVGGAESLSDDYAPVDQLETRPE
jgi:hypothetical protein